MVRIKDVAKSAGVSVGTVDRVLHNRGNVAKEVELKVKTAIEDLGYRPNLAARSLAKQSAHKIAILLPDSDHDEYWLSQASGIQRALLEFKDFGLKGDMLSFNDLEKNDLLRQSRAIFNGGYQAVLIAPTIRAEAEELMNLCDLHQMPYVQINSYIKRSGDYTLGYVGQDSYQSGQLAAKLLDVSSGAGGPLALLHLEQDVGNSSHLLAKESGFNKYLATHSERDVVIKQIAEFKDQDHLRKHIEVLLEDHPHLSGLFITNSRVNLVCDVLKQINRTDLSLIGFDILTKNINALKSYNRLFLINQNPSLQGYYGVSRLFDHFLKNKSVKETLHLPLDIITLENVSNYNFMQARDNVSSEILDVKQV